MVDIIQVFSYNDFMSNTAYQLSFNEDTNCFEIFNRETGMTASVPDHEHAWKIKGEWRPDIYFSKQGKEEELFAFATGSFHDNKEVGFYHAAENWVCIIRTRNDRFILNEMDGKKVMYLGGKRLPIDHPFKDNSVYNEEIQFNFYDLNNLEILEITMGATLLKHPDKPEWYVMVSDEVTANKYPRQMIEDRLNRWMADHELYAQSCKKYAEQSIRSNAGSGDKNMFRYQNHPEGLLFEIRTQYNVLDKNAPYKDDDYTKSLKWELLEPKGQLFFYKRAEVDQPLYEENGIAIYRTSGGLQIEDSINKEKFFYVEDKNLLIRAAWDVETMPLDALHDQLQIFDLEHPGYMPRVSLNCSGGSGSKEFNGFRIEQRIFLAIKLEDWKDLAFCLLEKEKFKPEFKDKYDERRYAWHPFAAPSNSYSSAVARNITNFRAGNALSSVLQIAFNKGQIEGAIEECPQGQSLSPEPKP